MGQPVSVATSGIQVLIGDVGTTPAEVIANLSKLDGLPESDVKTYDLTRVNALNDDDTADMNMYVGFGKIDNGDLSFTMGFSQTQVGSFYDLRGVLKAWKILFISGAYLLFNGGITKIKPQPNTGEEVLFGITVKLSGVLSLVTAEAAAPVQIEGAVTKTASYNGTSHDLGADYAPALPGAGLEAMIQITAIDRATMDETYSFVLQESSDNAAFTACGAAVSTTTVGTLHVAGIVSKRYVRVAATIGGTTPSVTYVTNLQDLIY